MPACMQAYNVSCSISTPALMPAGTSGATSAASSDALSAAPVLVSVDLSKTGVSAVQTTSIDLAGIAAANRDPPVITLEVRPGLPLCCDLGSCALRRAVGHGGLGKAMCVLHTIAGCSQIGFSARRALPSFIPLCRATRL